jgi:pimeloyl-ACP methyl ester carboxylesterase
MLKRILFVLPALLLVLHSCSDEEPKLEDPFSYRGTLISHELIQSWTTTQVDSLLLELGLSLPVNYGLDIYKVVYETVDARGESATVASGALVVPVGSTDPLPLTSYQHGTVIHRDGVPSRLSYEITLGILFGATGNIVSMPDYLGLGDSPGMHPYVHAKSEATASVDMLRASKDVLAELKVDDNGQLFLFGYSQGGHSTMALTKEIEEFHQDEFSITASAPMSGPYDIDGAQTDVMLSEEPYSNPFYMPYTLLAYNDVYQIYDSPSDFFKEPWATTLPPLFDGYHEGYEIDELLPERPVEIIRDDVLESFTNNMEDPFRLLLTENDLTNWAPDSPIRMYYCTGDEQVIYLNALNAREAFLAQGVDVPAINGEALFGGGSLDHGGCVEPVMLAARIWFDSLVE